MAGEKADCIIVGAAYSALAAERDALSQQLAEARNAAISDCLSVVRAQLLIDWADKNSPAVDGANRMKDAITRNIEAIKTPTTGEDSNG